MASVDGARASDKPTDAYYKLKCEACARSGLVKEASTFCKQCEEYMCVTCASLYTGLNLASHKTMISGSDLDLTGKSLAASRRTRPESTGQSLAASRSTHPVSTGQSVTASRSTHHVSTGQSVAASRSTHPESTGPSCVDQPDATSGCACPEYSCKSWLDVKVVSSTEINALSTDVTGSAVMPDGRVILADRKNNQIILLDKEFTVQSRLTLKGGVPHDLAVYGDDAAVVTMPGWQLQYIHVETTTLRAGHTIPIGPWCQGVAVHSGEIYVSVYDGQYGRHVQVVDTRGNVTRRIGADVHGTDRRDIYPGYITVGTGGTIYISDCGSDHIACYTSTGDVVYDMKHEGMSAPMGMLLDKDDNLLVCGSRSNTIHVLGKDVAHHRVILSSSDGVVCPLSVAYRRSDQTLIVTMKNISSVRAFKLN